MSEYWKSTDRYWCKHCSTYVKDTPFEKKQHENTGKHQGNLKRFLRGIQNDHEKNQREKERVKAEVERLNKVVSGAGPTDSSQNKNRPPRTSHTTGNLSAEDQQRQWAQLAEMGIAVPTAFHAATALPGQWEITSERVVEDDPTAEKLNKGIRKRKLDADEEEQEAISGVGERKGWGSRIKTYPDKEEVDIDDLFRTNLPKKELSVPAGPEGEAESERKSISTQTILSEHSARKSSEANRLEFSDSANIEHEEIKNEHNEANQLTPLASVPEVTSTPIFKKRKAKAK